MKIAIIGAGITGSSILKRILTHKNTDKIREIYIFDRRSYYGAGMPYENDSDDKKLNVANSIMNFDEDKKHYEKWLESKGYPNNEDGKMTSRVYYGEYLHEYFKEYFENSKVKFVDKNIVDINIIDKYKYELVDENKISYDFNAVFISIGRPIYKDPYKLSEYENFIQDPYPLNKKFKDIKNHHKIGIIGAGATSVDIYRHLKDDFDLKNPIYFLTRKSSFKLPNTLYEKNKNVNKFSFSNEWIDKNIDEKGFLAFDKVKNQFKEDLESEGINFLEVYDRMDDTTLDTHRKLLEEYDEENRYVIAYLREFYKYHPRVFGLLNKEDRDYFLENYHDKIDVFIGGTPPYIMREIIKDFDNGVVKEIKNLEEIKYDEGKFKVTADEIIDFDILLNSTGFEFSLEENAKTNKFINNLLNKDIIQPYENGNYVSIKWPESTLLSKRYGEIKNIFFLGLFVFGLHYRNNDAPAMYNQGQLVAEDFMNKL